MTTLADLLTPEQCEALEAKAKDLPYRVIKAATDPNPPRQDTPAETVVEWQRPALADAEVTVINGVEVDLRSEGFIDTACADCTAPLKVEVAPRGVDLARLIAHPRVAVCLDCGQARLRDQRGTLVYQPIQTPVQNKETELDLTKYSDAEFAALAVEARQHMVAEAAAALPEKREKAKRRKAESEAADEALRDQERAAKPKVWMGEFAFYAKFDSWVREDPRWVPALDFTKVGLDELVPAKVRSPYNKVLHMLGEPLLDKEHCTYRGLRKVHKRLWKQSHVAYDAPKQATSQGDRLVADLEPDAKAKVEAYAKVTGMSVDQAHSKLASLSLV